MGLETTYPKPRLSQPHPTSMRLHSGLVYLVAVCADRMWHGFLQRTITCSQGVADTSRAIQSRIRGTNDPHRLRAVLAWALYRLCHGERVLPHAGGLWERARGLCPGPVAAVASRHPHAASTVPLLCPPRHASAPGHDRSRARVGHRSALKLSKTAAQPPFLIV